MDTGIPTPHINAGQGDFAPTVLMPGDPLRAQWIAENFLDAATQVNKVRNIFGYTGRYRGKRVSVMASGMGVPSISIYAQELFQFYGVKNIVRIGSAGALQQNIQIKDLLISMGASTDSQVNRKRFRGHDFAAIADFHLLETAVAQAREQQIQVRVGNTLTADLFYDPQGAEAFAQYQKMGILAVEMEAAGLYGVAAELGKQALCILTVSDHICTGECMSSEERQLGFEQMSRLALESAAAF